MATKFEAATATFVGLLTGLIVGRTWLAPAPKPIASDESALLSEVRHQRALIEQLPARIAAQSCAEQIAGLAAVGRLGQAPNLDSAKPTEMEAVDDRRRVNGHDAQETAKAAPSVSAPEDLAEFARGEQLIATATSSGRWTVADKTELHKISRTLTPDQVDALTQEFRKAFNEGKIELER